MTSWLLFGAGGSGAGAETLKLVLEEKRPVIAVVRNVPVAAELEKRDTGFPWRCMSSPRCCLCLPCCCVLHDLNLAVRYADRVFLMDTANNVSLVVLER